MPFTVSLTFAGLCMAAMDERDPSNPRLHLLAMKCSDGNDYHRPVLLYPSSQDSSGNAGGPTSLSCADLTNSAIAFSLGTTPLDLRALKQSHLGPLDALASTGMLDASYVINDSRKIAGARITLSTGRWASEGPLTTFKASTANGTWDGQLTTYTEWQIEGVAAYDGKGQECLTLWLQTLDCQAAAPVKTQLPLYPTTDGWVRLVFLNALRQDTPPNQPKTSNNGDVADHYAAYFSAFPGKAPTVGQYPVINQQGTYSASWPLDQYTGGCTDGNAIKGTVRTPGERATLVRPVCFGALVEVGP